MESADNSNENDRVPHRWTLARDILVLQLKLVVDGLRDVLLVPVSLTVGAISLIKGGNSRDNEFYRLLRLGRRSERWINLFGPADRVYGPPLAEERFPAESIDEIVGRVESFLIAEYRRGGMTMQAMNRLDRALDSLHKMASGSRKGNADSE